MDTQTSLCTGQSINLAHLAPFVNISRQKIIDSLYWEFDSIQRDDIDDDEIAQIAERRLRKEIKDAVQTMNYQWSTISSSQGQTPFITLFMYLKDPSIKDNQTEYDLALLIEEVLKQRIQGVKNEDGVWVTPTFPKLIYVLDDNNINEDAEYFYLTELAAKCTAKRMVPDYISAKMMKKIKGDVYSPMGCRSFLTPDEKNHKYWGRLNKGVVTINLPHVALSSGGNIEQFWKILQDRLELCHEALQIKHQRLLDTPSDVAPILWQHGALARLKKGEKINKLLFDNYSTISLGYAGLYECVKYMTGLSHTDEAAKSFARSVMEYLNKKCDEWRSIENISYSIYGTPQIDSRGAYIVIYNEKTT